MNLDLITTIIIALSFIWLPFLLIMLYTIINSRYKKETIWKVIKRKIKNIRFGKKTNIQYNLQERKNV